jgi:hypothetical protein
MISNILLLIFFIYLAMRFVELLILLHKRLSRALKPGSEKPPSGDADRSGRPSNASSPPSSSLPGIYAVNYYLSRGGERSELMIAATPEILPEVFFDLVCNMGERIILTLGENLPGDNPRQMISFTPPLDSQQLEGLFADFADVIQQLYAIEMAVQNTEKCCHLTLNPDKSLILHACNATPYITALERRGLRKVETCQVNPHPHRGMTPNEREVIDEKMAQLKQKLEISSSIFCPAPSWIN